MRASFYTLSALLLGLSAAARAADVAPGGTAPMPKLPPSPISTTWTAPTTREELKSFLDLRHADVIAGRPDLFQLKLEKAQQSDFAFFRGFPELVYLKLKESAQAAKLAASPRVRLNGDFHAENVELLAAEDKHPVPQVNDLDDSTLGPSALDVARGLAGAALLQTASAQPADLIAEARAAYDGSLSKGFQSWRDSLPGEKAVDESSAEDRQWRKHAGKKVHDAALAAKLRKAAGLSDDWDVYDRRGAGLSSIGLRRYMFVSDKHGHAVELKQLRAPAPAFFTRELPESDADRTERAYADLRQIPADASTVSFEGLTWVLRRREAMQRGLALEHARSAARVLGGLLAQLHRPQALPTDLRAAAASVRDSDVQALVSYVKQLRRWLDELVKADAWGKSS